MLARLITFEEVALAKKEPTRGFDYLRIGLALAVVIIHCYEMVNPSGHRWFWLAWPGPIEHAILPAFFALSGYLIAGSMVRNTLPQFITLRLARIVPALAVEICLTALILGAAVTTLPIGKYLASPQFHAYFLNIVGDIQYTLPGVFREKTLNRQLWTIPYEFECYALFVVLALATVLRRRHALLLLFVVAVLGATSYSILVKTIYHVGWNVPGRMLVMSFIAGVILHKYRASIPHHLSIAVVCALLGYVALYFPDLVFLGALPLAYLTVYVGLLRPPPIPFGDLSYGVYLFHFPIAVALFELLSSTHSFVMLLLPTLVLTAVFAAGSWRFVEKPVLDHKKQLLRVVDKISGQVTSILHRKTTSAQHVVPSISTVIIELAPRAGKASTSGRMGTNESV